MNRTVALAVAAVLLLAACTLAAPSAPSSGPAAPASSRPSSPAGATPSRRPGPVTDAPSDDQLAAIACVEAAMLRLDLDARVGQVVMGGVPLKNVGGANATGVAIRHRLAGVFLSGRSRVGRGLAAPVRRLSARYAAAGLVAPHVAVDQEGGAVQSIKGPGFPAIPAALEQGAWDVDVLAQRARAWSTALHGIGVTLNLGPVADTVPAGKAAGNPPIGAFRRHFGTDPERVAASVRTVVRAHVEAGVMPTVKHFPGLGRVGANTDTSAAASDLQTDADDPYLVPFRQAMATGEAAVMVSSARYPQLDPRQPAMWSGAVVTGLLRGRLGFSGLVVSDDLGRAVAARARPTGQRAVDFLRAGGDLVLTTDMGTVPAMVAALEAQARRSPAFSARLDNAVRHVLTSKARLGLLRCARNP